MDVEDGLELMGVVGKHVGAVRILGTLVEVVVLLNQLLQLRLHIGHFVGWHLVFVQGYSRLLQGKQARSGFKIIVRSDPTFPMWTKARQRM